MLITDVKEFPLRKAFEEKDGRFTFEVNKTFISKYKKCIDFYIKRLRAGATAGVRGKTDVKFWNPKTEKFENVSELNENILDYTKSQKGDIEGGEINIVVSAFLAQSYAKFLDEKLSRMPGYPRKTLVGFDTRHFSAEIAEIITRVLAGNGFKVLRNKDNRPSPTPYNSLLTYLKGCIGSLNVTASHNPADQNGIKPNNEKGHLDSDDDLERFLNIVETMYNDGNGSGKIEIAPLGESVEEIDFDLVYIEDFIIPMLEDDFIDLSLIRNAITGKDAGSDKNKWGFVIDGIGGTGGYTMERILDRIFSSSWRDSIRIINKDYDPNMKGIPKPDPTKPEVLEQSGLLSIMSRDHNIIAGGTGDNDWDRFTAAIKIEEDYIAKAKLSGIYVSKQRETYLAQFTADQMYTLFGEYQLRKIAQKRYKELKSKDIDLHSDLLDESIRSREIDLSDCYIITTYPSSILTEYLTKYYGANLIYTSVGFKNIGLTVTKDLEEGITKDPNFRPIYVLGKEESGGNGFGFLSGARSGPDGKPWLGTKDKDTSLNVLKLMEISADAYMMDKNIVDLYAEMLNRIGVLTFYERIDWYTKNSRGRRCDARKRRIALKADKLELDENAPKIAKLLRVELSKAPAETIEVPNSFLWVKIASEDKIFSDGTRISKGEPIYNRVYDPPEKKPAQIEGEWTFIPVKARKFNLKDGGYFTVFHAGEGPKITLYDGKGNPVFWTLIRPSGTEVGLIRSYNEIVCSKDDPNPWLLAEYIKPFLTYFGVPEYYDGDSYLQRFNEQSLTSILKKKYGENEPK